MKISRIGVDLAKNVFQHHGVDRHDQVVLKRRLNRDKWLSVLLKNTEPGVKLAWKRVLAPIKMG